MSLTRAEIAAVVAELAPLSGGAVQRVFAPAPRTVVLGVRVPGRTFHLLVSAEADLCRLHLVDRRPKGAAAPFQAGLRAEIEGSRLTGIRVAADDRVVTLDLEIREGTRHLVAELTGRHGNLFLLDGGGRVLHTAVPNLSRRRDNVRGRVYEAPRPRPRGADEEVRFEAAAGPFGMNAAVAAVYGPRAEAARLEAGRRAVARPLKTAAARHRRTLARLAADAARAKKADRYRRDGELLKGVLHEVHKGDTEVRVTDWFDPEQKQVEIPLDPARTPTENLEWLFHQHRRLRDAPGHVAARRESVETTLERIEGCLAALAAATDEAVISRIAEDARAGGLLPRAAEVRGPGEKGAASPPRVPYRRFRSRTGKDVLVGRGAKDNHALTFGVAKGNDIWLHARDAAGAHVVVPTGGTGETDEQTLLDAAHLAAHFSRARGEAIADIAWTHRKQVRHPKGAPPGRVTMTGERTLVLRVEPGRVKEILAREVPP